MTPTLYSFVCRCNKTISNVTADHVWWAGGEKCHSIKCQQDALLEMASRAQSVTVDDLADEHAKGMVTE